MTARFKTTWFYAATTQQQEVADMPSKMRPLNPVRATDLEEYASLLEQKYNEMDADGYDVINVIPIAAGHSECCAKSNGDYVGDVGFSITRGAIIVGEKRG